MYVSKSGPVYYSYSLWRCVEGFHHEKKNPDRPCREADVWRVCVSLRDKTVGKCHERDTGDEAREHPCESGAGKRGGRGGDDKDAQRWACRLPISLFRVSIGLTRTHAALRGGNRHLPWETNQRWTPACSRSLQRRSSHTLGQKRRVHDAIWRCMCLRIWETFWAMKRERPRCPSWGASCRLVTILDTYFPVPPLYVGVTPQVLYVPLHRRRQHAHNDTRTHLPWGLYGWGWMRWEWLTRPTRTGIFDNFVPSINFREEHISHWRHRSLVLKWQCQCRNGPDCASWIHGPSKKNFPPCFVSLCLASSEWTSTFWSASSSGDSIGWFLSGADIVSVSLMATSPVLNHPSRVIAVPVTLGLPRDPCPHVSDSQQTSSTQRTYLHRH